MSSKKTITKNCKTVPEFEELCRCANKLKFVVEIDKLYSDEDHEEDHRLFLNIRDNDKKLVATRTLETIIDLPKQSADILNEISK